MNNRLFVFLLFGLLIDLGHAQQFTRSKARGHNPLTNFKSKWQVGFEPVAIGWCQCCIDGKVCYYFSFPAADPGQCTFHYDPEASCEVASEFPGDGQD